MTLGPPDWMASGTCASLPIEITDPLFFSGKHRRGVVPPNARKAIAICSDCEVQQECREYGEATDSYGVWGGVLRTELHSDLLLRDKDVRDVRVALGAGERPVDIARVYGVTAAYISHVKHGRARSDVA